MSEYQILFLVIMAVLMTPVIVGAVVGFVKDGKKKAKWLKNHKRVKGGWVRK